MSADFQGLGRALLLFGALLIVVGSLFLAGPKIPWLGRLPGDILIQREGFTFYFPFTSCVLASLGLMVMVWIIGWLKR